MAQILASLDPELQQAVAEVDRSLIRLSLAQSPRDRLRSSSKMMRSLMGFGREPITRRPLTSMRCWVSSSARAWNS